MSDSDDYGDGYDGTEFLNAATQAQEKDLGDDSSHRSAKRQKISHHDSKSGAATSKKKQGKGQHATVSSNAESGDDASDATPSSDSKSSAQSMTKRVSSKKNKVVYIDSDNSSPAKTVREQKMQGRIHVPTMNLDITDVFYTQPPQEHSPPWKPRGAIWAKPTPTIGVHRPSPPKKFAGLEALNTMSLPGRNSISSRSSPQVPTSPHDNDDPQDLEESPKLPRTTHATTDYDPAQELADLPSDAFASSGALSPQKEDGDVVETGARKRLMAPQNGLRQTTLFGGVGPGGQIPPSQVNKRYNFVVDQKAEPPTHHKLDHEAMKTWVYPTNLGTIRDYQFNIVQRGLFNNLLVALPTGLGKTFIAATIMLNWYRWTTEAQIVFVAPTKPLVSQQVGACFNIAGIPRSSTTMLTGGVSQALRSEEWRDKRVFFMTPQTLLNDLKAGYADPKKIVLLVVDEAHRATGAYAYVEVVSFLRRFNQSFRVLALTATPGADLEAVQKVIDGLDISKVEIRTEDSMDIYSYIHQRKIEKHVFHNSDEMEMCMELYAQALQPLVKIVAGQNAYWSTNPCDLTPFGCHQAKNKWMSEAGRNANQGIKNMVNSAFTILASISHGMQLLKYHGMGSFYIKMKEFQDEAAKTKSKYKKQILDSDAWKKMMTRMHGWVNDENFVGHPKLEFLQEVILDHFVNAGDGHGPEEAPPSQTRIMVFANFRDSAEEIVRILSRHKPMIRPRVFVGQAHGKNSEGMNQREQLEVVEKFKLGTYNTLIATSIGEEGLDIGEVDLIICYDSKASPIRMLQRMGRTGRKREGRIVMLQMHGKEENDALKASDNYKKMQEIIANGTHFNFHDEISRRILPPDVRPVVERRVVEIPLENSQQDWLPEPKKGRKMKKPAKKFHMPDNVLTGFVTAGRVHAEVVPKGRKKPALLPVQAIDELFEFPPLESVWLDEEATRELGRRFQTVYDDDESPMISELDLSRSSDQQRVLCTTHCICGSGRVTKNFVSMMQRMHAMDQECLDMFEQHLHYSDCESNSGDDWLVNDEEQPPAVPEDMWADDDPASQVVSKTKAKAKPVKAKPAPKPKARPEAVSKAPIPLKAAAPRGQPRKNATEVRAPAHPTDDEKDEDCTPPTKTRNWQASGLAQEGEESSPPPTDARFRIASQADTLGSDDTLGEEEMQDPLAYKNDSDLVSFIVDNSDDVEIPASSLPSLRLSGIGRGTQAILQAAQPRQREKAIKLFTSDISDDDSLVLVQAQKGTSKIPQFVVDSASEEEQAPAVPRRRGRRIVDDEDEDE